MDVETFYCIGFVFFAVMNLITTCLYLISENKNKELVKKIKHKSCKTQNKLTD
jgi:uncharacterized membrane protein YciS (DUF1049 family)